MLAVNGLVHPAHLLRGDVAGQRVQRILNPRPLPERLGAHQGHGLVGREVVPVVRQRDQSERLNGPIGRIGGDHVHLAGSYICQQAMVAGRIDAYVEYTGTALTAVLKQPVDRDPKRVLDTVRRLYWERYNVAVAQPLGFENTFAMVIRGDDARALHLTSLSQAARYTPNWRLGAGYEFEQRPDGLAGLSAAYGLKFAAAPRTMDLGLLYRALNAHQVDMIAANSTDGPIQAFGLKALADDRDYFPPYQAVPLVRAEALTRWPQIQIALNALAGKITAEDMRAMNEAIDGQHRDPAEVVREFRNSKGV